MEELRILVVDDDSDVAWAMANALTAGRMHCEIANGGAAALAACRQLDFDAVVTDVRMNGMDGVELLGRLKQLQPDVPVILVTGSGTIAAAVDAVKRGAAQYITKPCDAATLRSVVEQAVAGRARMRASARARSLPQGTEELIGKSAAMGELRSRIELVAHATSPVLVQGETGSGKELVARAIHACGPRRGRPFVTVNASAIPDALLESEIFGHARGAFTGATQAHRGLFAEADGGTLVLDEIGDMPMGLQAKLLRVLQEGEIRAVGSTRAQHVDVRVIAATHRRLYDAVREGRFREDLYYRLDVVTLNVPPLRARVEDIPELVSAFFANARRRAPNTPAKTLSSDLVELLVAASWPGNVRELESTVERLVVFARSESLSRADLLRDADERAGANPERSNGDPSLESLIQRHVESILEQTSGNRARAAKLLGVDLSTLYRWQRKWQRAK